MASVASRIAPGLVAPLRQWRWRQRLRKLARQTPEQVFSSIYREKMWGTDAQGKLYSGEGSRDERVVGPYTAAVLAFLAELGEPVDLVDLGCGDFAVGGRIAPLVRSYVGCDVVPDLVTQLNNEHASERIRFQQVDLTADALPVGSVATLRQVLQHLSNAQIVKILPKLATYDHVIITEHVPAGTFEPNLDKPMGPGIRLEQNSGIVIGQEPFLLAGYSARLLCSVDADGGLIETKLWSRNID